METQKQYMTLEDFKEFFSGMKKMNRKTLEEFCVQKMCEVVAQNSDLGKLRTQQKTLEDLGKTLKTKVESLTKQLRDLEIVNQKLIQDFQKYKSNQIDDLVPVKITRSVGLQVGLSGNTQRRPSNANAQPANTTNNASPVQTGPRKPRPSLPARIPSTSPSSPVKVVPPVKTPEVRTPEASLLTKALTKTPQNNVTPQNNEQPNKIIDLTDEEDVTKKVTTAETTTTTNTTTSTVATTASATPTTNMRLQQVRF